MHESLQAVLRRLGLCEPTPVQEKAIPRILSGVDVLVTAPTGSGKTEAAVLPAASRVLASRRREHGGISILYITPLRSLNRDIFARLVRLLSEAGLSVFLRHGDSTSGERREFLRRPFDFVIVTPETLEYLLSSSARFREMLSELRVVIIDELHELIGSKRGAELAVVLERLERRSRHRVQRIGVSATLGNVSLAARFLGGGRHVEVVEDPSPRRYEVRVETPRGDENSKGIAVRLGVEPDTVARLRRILYYREVYGHVLVFTNTRDTAELLSKLLALLAGEGEVRVHHGSLSREERLETERLFREGKVPVLVATSSLELGIDIGHVEFVVQYLSPRQAVKLVQRIGRSGHALGKVSKGAVLTLPNFYDALESLVLATRGVRGDIEEPRPYVNPLDVLAHEVAGIVDEYGEIDVYTVYDIVTRAYPFQSLTWDEFNEVIEALEAARIVRREGRLLRRGRRLKAYHYSVTMIPDVKQYVVVEHGSGRRIGVLDDVFVALLEPGSEFVLAGQVWRVVEIGESRVLVEKVESGELKLPAWEGDLIPVEWKAAREAGSLLRRMAAGFDVRGSYPLGDDNLWSLLASVLDEHVKRGYPVPSDRKITVEVVGDVVALLGFYGTRLAKTLELLLVALVEDTLGYTPRSSSNAYAVLLQFTSMPSREYVENLVGLLARIAPEEARVLVNRVARRSGVYMWKLYHVAVRMGLVEKGAKPERRMLEALRDTVAGREALREMIHDKLDFEALDKLLSDLKSGRVKVEVVYGREPSPLLLHAIEIASSGDRVKSETMPSSVLAEVLKRQLEEKRVRLVCLRCGEVFEERIGALDERPKCPRCGSGFLAPTRLEASVARRLVEARRRGERLRGEEAKMLRELVEAADLVLSYGKMAVYALATHGVGPRTARKVLGQLAFGEEAFFKALVEAEKRYRRTRRYWGD